MASRPRTTGCDPSVPTEVVIASRDRAEIVTAPNCTRRAGLGAAFPRRTATSQRRRRRWPQEVCGHPTVSGIVGQMLGACTGLERPDNANRTPGLVSVVDAHACSSAAASYTAARVVPRDCWRRVVCGRVKKHVLILGAGFGGLELATRLSETIADAVRVTLIDRNDSFFFGFSKLEVMLGRQSAEDVKLSLPRLREGRRRVPPGDGDRRRPGRAASHHRRTAPTTPTSSSWRSAPTTTWPPRRASRRAGTSTTRSPAPSGCATRWPTSRAGGCSLSVLGQPFKCPPAPFEGSFLLHEYFTQRGIRDSVQMSTTFPMARPVPVTGEVSQMFRDGLAARGVEELPEHLVTGIDPATRTAQLASGETLPVRPVRRHPGAPGARRARRRRASRSTAGCPSTSPTSGPSFPGVYALGDVCTGPRTVPKAGIFAESAARVVADDIAAAISGAEPPAPYEGIRRLLRRVRRRTREQGRGQLPPRRCARRPAIRPLARVRRSRSRQFGATRRARWFGR